MNIRDCISRTVSCIYCLRFPNGKRYIGKAKNLGYRLKMYEDYGGNSLLDSAILEYGYDSIDVDILREVRCSDGVDLDLCLSLLEIKYIREEGTLEPNGYNVSLGGEVLGIPVEYLTTDSSYIKSYYSRNKVLLSYDLDGRFISEYCSISRFSYEMGVSEDSVRSYIGKMKPFCGKMYLRVKRYDYIPEVIEVPKFEVKERVRYKDVIEERVVERVIHKYVPALKYDMNGNFCGEYSSKSAACKSFTNSNNCGWGEYHKGYILFKKVSDDYPDKIEPYYILNKKILLDYYVPASELSDKERLDEFISEDNSKHKLCIDGKYTNIKHQFKVYQYDLKGNLINTYESIRDASHETGIPYPQIYNCLRGATSKAAGFKWKKSDD